METELLAPAGTYECLEAAINAGADAVYAGTERFSARAYAGNLTVEEFISGIRQAHLRGVSVYLTLNTLINTTEYEEAYNTVKPLYESGLDGIIIQDTGLIEMLRTCFPELKLHASTQMSIMNTYGARLMREQGFSRIVPARELTLPEIRHIKDDTGLEIECFIHGAMCYSYSGLCLMSSMIGGRSGNRGRCAGTCRLPFDVLCDGHDMDGARGKGSSYPLSMKDMCTLDIIPQLIDAGIDSFKIEGRMKSPEYVAGVTGMYRKYIDKYLEHGRENYHISDKDRNRISSLYIRTDISSGYYTGEKGRQLITLDSPGYNGNDESFVTGIRDKYVHSCEKISAEISAYIHEGEPAVITATSGFNAVSVTGNTAEPARKAPLLASDIESRLKKTGESGFICSDTDIDMSDNVFMTVSALNDLRRQAYDELADRIIEDKGYAPHRIAEACITPDISVNHSGIQALDISISTLDQLKAMLDTVESTGSIGRLYIGYDIAASNVIDNDMYRRISSVIPEIYISMPVIMRDRIIRGNGTDDKEEAHALYGILDALVNDNPYINGILAHTYDEIGYAVSHMPGKGIVTDTHIYAFNTHAAGYLASIPGFKGFTCPYELNKKGLYELKTGFESSLVIYGYIPMMITAGCIRKTYGECLGSQHRDISICGPDSGYVMLRDRKGIRFPVVCDCRICTNIIYNERPLCLYDQVKREKTEDKDRLADRYRIDLTIEDREKSADIIRHFLKSNEDADAFFSDMPTTTGHMKRGAI
ncbi:MAG: U32 family peptidase [Lachnospiraceae bacterium]|nr:U32 family peptidase [Lachnospiraceae bacterium]